VLTGGYASDATLRSAAEHDPGHLARLYAPRTDSQTSDVGSAFRDASTVFRTRMPNTGAKRIFLITDNDDPSRAHPEQLKAALNNRRDLLDLGYDLDPFFFPPSKGDAFNLSKFYMVSSFFPPGLLFATLFGGRSRFCFYWFGSCRRSSPPAWTTTTDPTRRGCTQACRQRCTIWWSR